MSLALFEPKPTKTAARPDGDFVDLGYRPVFKEHVRDGVKFGKREMERILRRNNARIEDTGDFSPLVIGHTKDNGDNAPEVIGFVGPYRLGKVGNKNPKWAILGRCRVFKADADKVRKYPRLSVEYWADDGDPTDGYFDPISLLGAETPELDLGVHYSKRRGSQLVRYSKQVHRFAAAPGGSNTFVPGTGDEKKSTVYQKGSAMLTPEDLQQIIEALKPVVQEAVASATMGGGDAGMEGDLDGVPPVDGEMPGEIGDEMPAEGNAMPAEVPGDAPPDAEGAETPPDFGDDEDDDVEIDDEDEPEQYMASSDPAEPMAAQYAKERNEYRAKYRKEVAKRRDVEAERDRYKKRVEAAELGEKRASRYAKLQELQAQGYVLDLEEEADECLPMSDERFERHLTKVAERYRKVPIAGVNVKPTPIAKPEKVKEKGADEKLRYAKSEQAKENCLEARKKGIKLDYKTEYERLLNEAA